MAEYIEREAAQKAIMERKWEIGSDGAMAMETICTVPAAEVEPIIHAHWLVDYEYLTCSRCGESYYAGDTKGEVEFLLEHGDVNKFCHGCGAHMDEEGQNEK